MTLRSMAGEATLLLRNAINSAVDRRWKDPFGTEPMAAKAEYLELFRQARLIQYPEIDSLEKATGYAIDRDWLDELALHTQIVKKKSALAYPHGRLLYSLLREMIATRGLDFVTILETGTARGFSAICMAKAITDAGVDGRVISVDVLSHLEPQVWNCIDDHEGRKSRAQLLAPWASLARRVLFLQGDTLYTLSRIGLDRIHYAFLDAQHTEKNVLHEFEIVSRAQQSGDMVIFDDVTPAVFPGVVAAVDSIEALGSYSVKRLRASEQRAYAWARRK